MRCRIVPALVLLGSAAIAACTHGDLELGSSGTPSETPTGSPTATPSGSPSGTPGVRSFTGMVENSSGDAIAGVTVAAFDPASGSPTDSSTWISSHVSDADGKWTLFLTTGQAVYLSASAQGVLGVEVPVIPLAGGELLGAGNILEVFSAAAVEGVLDTATSCPNGQPAYQANLTGDGLLLVSTPSSGYTVIPGVVVGESLAELSSSTVQCANPAVSLLGPLVFTDVAPTTSLTLAIDTPGTTCSPQPVEKYRVDAQYISEVDFSCD